MMQIITEWVPGRWTDNSKCTTTIRAQTVLKHNKVTTPGRTKMSSTGHIRHWNACMRGICKHLLFQMLPIFATFHCIRRIHCFAVLVKFDIFLLRCLLQLLYAHLRSLHIHLAHTSTEVADCNTVFMLLSGLGSFHSDDNYCNIIHC